MSSEDNFDDFEELDSRSGRSSNEVNKELDSPSRRSSSEVDNELIYKLAWPTRDKINGILNRYAQVLCGETELAKEKLANENAILYQSLLNLPMKSNADVLGGSSRLSRVTLDLDASTRSQIVATLLANHGLVVRAESASEESKMKMVERNNRLVSKLAQLPFSRTALGPVNKPTLDGKNNDKADHYKITVEYTDEVAMLKSELSEKVSQHAWEMVKLNQKITGHANNSKKQAEELNKKVNELKRVATAIKGVGIMGILAQCSHDQLNLGLNRKTAKFEYELKRATAFLDSDGQCLSECFYAGQLAWYLSLRIVPKGEEKYLSLRLYANDCIGSSEDWSIAVNCELSVLDQSGGKRNCSGCFSREFGNTKVAFGFPALISVQNLRAGGYINKQDRVRVRVQLTQIGELLRGE